MMGFDGLYVVVMLIGLLLSLGAQAWVKGAVGRWSRVAVRSGLSGHGVAQLILRGQGIYGVRIEPVRGWLSDHYDPWDRTLRLSEANYYGRSVAALGIAAHEVGHAIQDAEGYGPMRLRQRLVPAANLGTSLGIGLVFLGMITGALGLTKLGVVLFAGFVFFTLVTLPVEIDASRRARRALRGLGVLGQQELAGVSTVLRAAAATYVAAAATAVLQLAYYLLHALAWSGDDG